MIRATTCLRPLALLALGFAAAVSAPALRAAPADFDAELGAIQRAWAEANYETPPGDAQQKAFETLAQRAAAFSGRYPARAEPLALWAPPGWTRHLAALLTLPAFVLIAAAYVPGSRIKAAIGHPMVAGVKVWAIAHLLSNGNLADVLLFGAFLLWAVLDFRSARQRDRAVGRVYRPGTAARDGLVVAVGAGVWALFAGFLHLWLIGVRPY